MKGAAEDPRTSEGAATDLVRVELARLADRVVVKVGSQVLARAEDGRLDRDRIRDLAVQIHEVRQGGRTVILVSSGAVAAGLEVLGLAERPRDLAHLQAVAACGQARLMQCYQEAFAACGLVAAQVLLTADDLKNRTRYLNIRNTLRTMLEYGIVPIVNENDTVAVDELAVSFGDNDRLAAHVTNLLRVPLMVILSHVEGLYEQDADGQLRVVPTVRRFTRRIWDLVAEERSPLGRGGMSSKLEAARMVSLAGENAIIAGGRLPNVLPRLLAGEPLGTLVLTQRQSLPARKRWAGFSSTPRGRLEVDAGAARALVESGRSLLAVGITRVEGHFRKGDVVAVFDPGGQEIARGLTNYAAAELRRIQGARSDQFQNLLGHRPYDEVIHRDNLIVMVP